MIILGKTDVAPVNNQLYIKECGSLSFSYISQGFFLVIHGKNDDKFR